MNGNFYKNTIRYITLAKGYILININTTSINFKKEIRTLFIPPKIWPLCLSLSIIGMITINSQEIRYFYRNIINQAKNFINQNGCIVFEIGYNQGGQVKSLLENAGFVNINVKQDLAGLDRLVIGFKL